MDFYNLPDAAAIELLCRSQVINNPKPPSNGDPDYVWADGTIEWEFWVSDMTALVEGYLNNWDAGQNSTMDGISDFDENFGIASDSMIMIRKAGAGSGGENYVLDYLKLSDISQVNTAGASNGDVLTNVLGIWTGVASSSLFSSQYANFYEEDNPSVTTIVSTGVYEIANGVLTKEVLSDFADLTVVNTTVTNNSLLKTYKLNILLSVSLEPASGNNQNIMIKLYNNGVALNGRACINSDNNKCQSSSFTSYVELAPSGALDIRLANSTSTTNVHLSDVTLAITEIT